MTACLPLRVVHALGAALGWLMWRSRSRAVHHVRVNLRIARPGLSPAERERLVRQAMLEAGKSISEMGWIWGRGGRRVLRTVREVRGQALIDAALAAPGGVIIAAPHLGCWELLNYWLGVRTRLVLLYRPPGMAALEPLLRKVRGTLAPEQVRARGVGVRTLYRRLAEGATVGILPDQKPRSGDGRRVPFFGRDAWTGVLLPRLAARTGATVIFAFAERLPRGRGYRLHFLSAPPELTEPDIEQACIALNRGVEQCAELAFSQYQWAYRRYSGLGLDNPYD